jgi:site-specific DNA-cytosine methylase
MSKIILDLCGGTGAWSEKYKEAGYIVINVTLPFYDVLKTEIKSEYTIFKGGIEKPLRVRISDIYGILASPVCTMFSLARTRTKTPRDLKQGMILVIACLNIIWECRYDHKLAFWCLENPMGILRQFLGKPAFTFNPCDFGDPFTKKTDLWGYFNIPKKKPVKPKFYISGGKRFPPLWGRTGGKSKDGKILRSITPPGFAKAFYEANK